MILYCIPMQVGSRSELVFLTSESLPVHLLGKTWMLAINGCEVCELCKFVCQLLTHALVDFH